MKTKSVYRSLETQLWFNTENAERLYISSAAANI